MVRTLNDNRDFLENLEIPSETAMIKADVFRTEADACIECIEKRLAEDKPLTLREIGTIVGPGENTAFNGT